MGAAVLQPAFEPALAVSASEFSEAVAIRVGRVVRSLEAAPYDSSVLIGFLTQPTDLRVLEAMLQPSAATSAPSDAIAALRAAVFTRVHRAVAALLRRKRTTATWIEVVSAPTDLDVLHALIAAERAAQGSPEEHLAAALDRGRVAADRLLIAEGGSLPTAEVAGLLGISVQAVHKRANKHQLLSFPGKGGRDGDRFPRCQFGEGAVLKGIPQVVAGMASHGPEVTLSFLISPSPRLEGDARPIDLLRAGKVAEVLRAVERYGEQGG